MTSIFARIKAYAIAVCAFFVVLFGAYWAGRRKGVADTKADHLEDAYVGREKADDAEQKEQDHVNKMDDGGVADELRRDWLRRKD